MTDYDDILTSAIKNSAGFPVDIELEGYPDVLFDIVFNKRVNDEDVGKIASALEKFFFKYNRWHLKPIHYISSMWGDPPEQINAFTIQIHIDFGGAMLWALTGVVKAIAKSGADIYRLILT